MNEVLQITRRQQPLLSVRLVGAAAASVVERHQLLRRADLMPSSENDLGFPSPVPGRQRQPQRTDDSNSLLWCSLFIYFAREWNLALSARPPQCAGASGPFFAVVGVAIPFRSRDICSLSSE